MWKRFKDTNIVAYRISFYHEQNCYPSYCWRKTFSLWQLHYYILFAMSKTLTVSAQLMLLMQIISSLLLNGSFATSISTNLNSFKTVQHNISITGRRLMLRKHMHWINDLFSIYIVLMLCLSIANMAPVKSLYCNHAI